MGVLGSIKVAAILTENGYTRLTDLTLESFRNGDKVFLFSDKNGKETIQRSPKRLPY